MSTLVAIEIPVLSSQFPCPSTRCKGEALFGHAKDLAVYNILVTNLCLGPLVVIYVDITQTAPGAHTTQIRESKPVHAYSMYLGRGS